MALTEIKYGDIASSKILNDNFEYLDRRINDAYSAITNFNATLISFINSRTDSLSERLNNELEKMGNSLKSTEEDINNQVNKIGNKIDEIPHVIKTYNKGNDWYYILSNGYCEQGGLIGSIGLTASSYVALLVPYADANYNIQITSIISAGQDLGKVNYTAEAGATANKTINGFTIVWNWGGRYWRTCGLVDTSKLEEVN